MKIYPFSPLLGANLCLSDTKRVHAFEEAINKTIKKGDIVLDVGTGTGILALLALKYGASKVYAIEIDMYLSSRIAEIAKQNGVSSQIEIIGTDVFKIDSIGSDIDVVLMEMITTGLIEEAQIPVYNHLIKKGIINPSTRIIPASHEIYATPLDYDFTEYGFHIPRAKHTALDDLRETLANRGIISTVEFNGTRIDPRVKKTIEYIVTDEGNLNAVGLTSIARLSEGVSLEESRWINHSVVVPVGRNINVKENDRVRLNVEYVMGYGFSTLQTKVFQLT